MSRIALISCTSSKKDYICQAKELYSESAAFRLEYELANMLADQIYILSAKYGLVDKETFLAPYDYTLMNKTQEVKKEWSNKVLIQLSEKFNLDKDEFIILAGNDYCEYLLPSIKNYWLPLKGKRQGERQPMLHYLLELERETNLCKTVHQLFNQIPRMNYKMIDDIPFTNGIYIMFEKGQKYGDLDRIVRVGTHTSDNRLKIRLKDHFINKNKDGSIFRKNIGKALLNKNHDDYIDIWTLDTSNKTNKFKVKKEKESEVENSVSSYLQENISFVCFEINDKEDRLRIEEALISLLNASDNFYQSNDWLGNFSPVNKISQSGLWLTQGLEANPLTLDEFEIIKNSIRFGNQSNQMITRSHVMTNNFVFSNEKRATTGNLPISEIREHICNILQEKKLLGETTCILRAGDLQKELGLVNATPSVCDAMTKKISYRYEILFTPPKGKSTRLTVKYYL